MQDLEALSKEQQRLDRLIFDYSIKLLSPFYSKRREIVREIPRFWSTVIGDTEPLRPYITFEDSLIFDSLEDLWIEWSSDDTRNFTISFSFGDNPHFEPQTLQKSLFWKEPEQPTSDGDADGYYESDAPTIIKWKSNSTLIKQHLKGGDESFFTWFEYTSTDNLEDRSENTLIARILVEDIYPTAIDLFKAAQDEQDIAEEYDISESD